MGMDPAIVDAKIEAAEARVDTEFAKLRGELDKLPGTWTLVTTVIGSAVTLFLAIIAVLAFGGDRFDGGLGLAAMQREQIERDARQDALIVEVNEKLDVLLERTKTE